MPQTEYVDVVNEKDEILETLPRAEAQKKGKRLRGVHVFIQNEHEEILVQWRRHDKKVYPRLFGPSASGLLMAQEDYPQAATRELEEELGITTKLKKIGTYQINKGHLINGAVFLGKWDGDVSNWEEEAEALDFWSPEDAEYMLSRYPYLLMASFRESLKLYLKLRRKKHDLA